MTATPLVDALAGLIHRARDPRPTIADVLEAVEDELAAARQYDQAKAIRGWLEAEELDGGLPGALLLQPMAGDAAAGSLVLAADEVAALRLLLRENPAADLADITTLGVEESVRRIDAAKALLRDALATLDPDQETDAHV